MFEEGDVRQAVEFGDADGFAKSANGGGRVAATAEAADGGHAWIIPTSDMLFLDKLKELALAHQGVGEVEARKFNLAGLRGQDIGQVADEPVIERAVYLELEGADGVGDLFKGVFQRVGKVIHGVDAPSVARVVMCGFADTVEDGVAHVHVGRGEIDFCAQHSVPLLVSPGAHFCKFGEVLVLCAGAPRAWCAGDGGRPAVVVHLFGAEVADVGEALLDELHGAIMHLPEIIGGLIVILAPVKAQPVDVFLDGVDVFEILLCRVGVIHAQVTFALEFEGEAEVQADGLCVADVEVPIGFRRETCGGGSVFSPRYVFGDDLPDEMQVCGHVC